MADEKSKDNKDNKTSKDSNDLASQPKAAGAPIKNRAEKIKITPVIKV